MKSKLKKALCTFILLDVFAGLSIFAFTAYASENKECDTLQTLSTEHLEIFKAMPTSDMLDVLEDMDRISASTLAHDNVSMEKFKELLLLKYTRASNTMANTPYRKQLINELKDTLVSVNLNIIENDVDAQATSRDLTDRLIKEFGRSNYFTNLRALGYTLPEEALARNCRCRLGDRCRGWFSFCNNTRCKVRRNGCGPTGWSRCNGKCS